MQNSDQTAGEPGAADSANAADSPDAAASAAAKNSSDSPTVAVCIPAHNEGPTIGAICGRITERWATGSNPLIDELVVIDDRSTDDTASQASRNGATVVSVFDILPSFAPNLGKGNAMWKGIAATTADIVVFCDADLLEFDPSYIQLLAAKLLDNPQLALVKGYYERGYEGRPGEGGRTTALMARPILSLFFPELATIRQPLGGEYAIRREVAEKISFVSGWGVEMGLLIDVAAEWGADAIGQVELGRRTHKHRSLDELSVQAAQILHLVMQRAGVEWREEWSSELVRPGYENLRIEIEERPPLRQVEQYHSHVAALAQT